MRCPKCGFMSFDMIENCVKCGKSISDAAIELEGTVAGVASPSFLRMPGEERAAGISEETAEVDMEEPLDLGVGDEEEVVDFSFDEEPSAEAESEEVELNLADEEAAEIELGEESFEGEETSDVDLSFDEPAAEEPVVEEDAIGISDLAPEADEEEVLLEETVEEEIEEAVEDVEAVGAAGLGLEDLKVDGIDLDVTPGAGDPEKVMPSVKTGTALDDFDVDLGDLLTGKED